MLNLSWQYLTAVVEQIKPESGFLVRNLIGNKRFNAESDTIKLRIKRGSYKIAPISNYGDPAIDVEKTYTIEEKSIVAPQIFLKENFRAEDVKSLSPIYVNPLEGTAANMNKEIERRAADTFAEMKDSIERTIEYMTAQLLINGKIDYTNPFTNKRFVLDLEVPSSQLSGTATWSNSANATPLTDLRNWVRAYAKANGIKPDMIIMGEQAAEYLLASAEYKEETSKMPQLSRIESINWELNADTEIIGTFLGIGTPVVYFGSYEDPKTGATLQYIPDNVVVLTNSKFWRLGFGAIFDYDIDPQRPVYKGEYFAKQKISADGKNKYLYLESHPVPFIELVDALRKYTIS